MLAQASGRLIRTADDRGVVAVLDPRLGTARYRWDIVKALPPMRRTRPQRGRGVPARAADTPSYGRRPWVTWSRWTPGRDRHDHARFAAQPQRAVPPVAARAATTRWTSPSRRRIVLRHEGRRSAPAPTSRSAPPNSPPDSAPDGRRDGAVDGRAGTDDRRRQGPGASRRRRAVAACDLSVVAPRRHLRPHRGPLGVARR